MKDKFQFFVPIDFEKAEKGKDNDNMFVKGIASTMDEDGEGEFLDPNGFDLNHINKYGYLNWHHQTKDNPLSIIGEPTKTEVVKGKGLYLEGELYKDSDMAKQVYKLGSILQKNSKKRRLGFSIEGKALERDAINPKRITKAKITGCAITFAPVNKNTLCEVFKGEAEDPILNYSQNLILNDLDLYKAETGKLFKNIEEEDEEDTEKGLDTTSGDALIPESLDKKIKEIKKQKNKKINKSVILSNITNHFEDLKKSEINKIYKLIDTFLNINQMEVTAESIEKAFSTLGIEKASTSSKFSKQNGEVDCFYKKMSDEDGGEYFRKMIKKGDKEEYADDDKYMKKGDSYVSINKAEEEEEGDDETPEEGTGDDETPDESDEENKMAKGKKVKKSEEVEELDLTVFEDLTKAIQDSLVKSNTKFAALGTILKGVQDEISELREENRELKEMIGVAPSRGRKSIRKANVVERFKSNDTSDSNDSLSMISDRHKILNILDSKTFAKGEFDQDFGNAMTSFEAGQGLPGNIIARLRSEDNIQIVQ